ncbi:hypothetical protein ATCC90586_010817 [Pythium insidiosum]|nr:hypothetical protein ATCC90586_010817 [Pythium insidiosum]
MLLQTRKTLLMLRLRTRVPTTWLLVMRVAVAMLLQARKILAEVLLTTLLPVVIHLTATSLLVLVAATFLVAMVVSSSVVLVMSLMASTENSSNVCSHDSIDHQGNAIYKSSKHIVGGTWPHINVTG